MGNGKYKLKVMSETNSPAIQHNDFGRTNMSRKSSSRGAGGQISQVSSGRQQNSKSIGNNKSVKGNNKNEVGQQYFKQFI